MVAKESYVLNRSFELPTGSDNTYIDKIKDSTIEREIIVLFHSELISLNICQRILTSSLH